MDGYQYKAFISYRHQSPDQDVAKKLHTLIETYRIPGDLQAKTGLKKMGRVFRDQEELPLSQDLGADIRAALDASEWLIVVCSPRYLTSKWCNAELEYFLSLGRRDRILPILVEGEPEEAFPEQLRFEERDGAVVEVEPLAADVRAPGVPESLKKLQTEKLRIFAPMLGVRFDDLYQRARRRRTRVIAGVTAACFALLSGFSGYTVVKNHQVTAQRNIAMNNQMQLLVEQANLASAEGSKLLAVKKLLEAGGLRKDVGLSNDSALQAALEYALYNTDFESVLTIDNDNRHFTSLTFSHNDKYLAGVTNLNSAALIDMETGKILYTVSRSDMGQLDSVGFTLDDRYFYMVDSWYGFVTMYDVATGERYRQLDASGTYTWQIDGRAIPMDGKLAVIKETCLALWDYERDTVEEILPLEGNGGFDTYTRPLILEISPDRQWAAMGSHGYGQGMVIKSLDGQKEIPLAHDPERGYMNLDYSEDGRYLAATSGDLYCVWDVSDGRMVLQDAYAGPASSSIDVALNADGSILLVMSADYLGAISVPGGEALWEKQTESIYVTEAYISSNGKYVAASGGISGIFDLRTGDMLCDQSGTLFSNDSKKILVDTYGTDPRLLATPELSTVTRVSRFDETLFETPRYTDPGVMLYVPTEHNVGEFYSSMPQNANRKSMAYTSPDLKYAAWTHYDGYIEIFDIEGKEQGVKLCTLAEHCWESVNDLIFSGDLMASCGGYDARCVLFDLKTQQIAHVLPGSEYCYGAEFSPDGSKIILLCGYARNLAYVYSAQTGNLLYLFECEENEHFWGIGFTEDGSKVAAKIEEGGAVTGALYPTLEELMEEASDR